MGHQHHLSQRKGYTQLVSAILQKMNKHKKIQFINFSKDKLKLLTKALRESGLAPYITVEDLENVYNQQDNSNIAYYFIWEPQNQKYSHLKLSNYNNGNINGTYYETDDVLANIQTQLSQQNNHRLNANIWYRSI